MYIDLCFWVNDIVMQSEKEKLYDVLYMVKIEYIFNKKPTQQLRYVRLGDKSKL